MENKRTSSYQGRIQAKNAYQAWYMQLGGARHKGQLPRGKKFRRAIEPIIDHVYFVPHGSSALATDHRHYLQILRSPAHPFESCRVMMLKDWASLVWPGDVYRVKEQGEKVDGH